jgi:hypothetical protein
MEKKNVSKAEKSVAEEMTPEQKLKSNQEKIILERRRIIEELNKINVPINASIISGDQTWSVRNIAFWRALKKRDDLVVEFIDKYLTEKK